MGGGTDLKQRVVGCHGDLATVEHQPLAEQREEAVTEHDLCLPPGQRWGHRVKGQGGILHIDPRPQCSLHSVR